MKWTQSMSCKVVNPFLNYLGTTVFSIVIEPDQMRHRQHIDQKEDDVTQGWSTWKLVELWLHRSNAACCHAVGAHARGRNWIGICSILGDTLQERTICRSNLWNGSVFCSKDTTHDQERGDHHLGAEAEAEAEASGFGPHGAKRTKPTQFRRGSTLKCSFKAPFPAETR